LILFFKNILLNYIRRSAF